MSFSLFLVLLSLVHCSLGISVCPTRTITSTSGRITSPNYPSNYNANTDCTLTISLPLDTKITFTFTSLDLEEQEQDICYDSVTISGITEKEFCGSRSTPPYMADANVVEIHMESDDSTELSGFDISYTSVQIAGLPPPINVCNTAQSDAIVTGGRVMSPNFPRSYNDNLDCKLTLKIPSNKKTIVSFDNVDIKYSDGCLNHKLLVSSSGGSKTVCGQGKPSNVTLTGDEVYFQFTAPGSSSGRKGFMIHYTLVDLGGDPGCTCSAGNMYAKRALTENNIVKRGNDDISLQFKTTEANGLLLYAKGSVRDYILLKLENGAITFEVDLGTGNATFKVVSQGLNDDNWHTVKVTRRGKSVSVMVDSLTEVTGTTPLSFTKLDLKPPNANLVVLGGFANFNYPFKGCVKNFVIDGLKPIEEARSGDASYSLHGGTLGTC